MVMTLVFLSMIPACLSQRLVCAHSTAIVRITTVSRNASEVVVVVVSTLVVQDTSLSFSVGKHALPVGHDKSEPPWFYSAFPEKPCDADQKTATIVHCRPHTWPALVHVTNDP